MPGDENRSKERNGSPNQSEAKKGVLEQPSYAVVTRSIVKNARRKQHCPTSLQQHRLSRYVVVEVEVGGVKKTLPTVCDEVSTVTLVDLRTPRDYRIPNGTSVEPKNLGPQNTARIGLGFQNPEAL